MSSAELGWRPRALAGSTRAPAVRLRHVWALLTLMAVFLGPASTPIGLADVWWTLKGGEWMVANGQLLVSDPFTTAPQAFPQINAQWLAQLGYYGLYRLGGVEMVLAGSAALATAAYGLVLAAGTVSGGGLRRACLGVAFAFVVGFSNLSPRPQALAYPLFGLFLLAVARAERCGDRRLLWALPAVTVVWANVHGSFFLGLLLLGCAMVGRALAPGDRAATARPYALALGACLLAACLTPYGPGSLVYVATIGSNPIIRDLVTEWAPTSVAQREGVLLYGSFAVFAAVALRSRARLTPTEWLVVAAFAWLALSSVRAVVWWGMAAGPILVRLAGEVREGPDTASGGAARERPLLNLALAALIVAVTVLSLPWFKATNPLLPEDKRGVLGQETPVGVVDFLRGHRYPGRLFNHLAWGGYFDWAAWPEQPPFVDGRIEIHPPRVWLDYLAIQTASFQWRELLERYGIGYLAISRRADAPLVAALRADGGWRAVYEDDQAIVFVRAADSEAPSRPAS